MDMEGETIRLSEAKSLDKATSKEESRALLGFLATSYTANA